MRLRAIAALVVASSLWSAPAAQAEPINLLVNGSFESGLTSWTTGGLCWDFQMGDASTMAYYRVTPYSGTALWLNDCDGYVPSVRQTVDLVVGSQYVVSGVVRPGFHYPYETTSNGRWESFEVRIDSTVLTLTIGTPDANGWATFTSTFTATSTTQALWILAQMRGDEDYLVDEVNLSLAGTASRPKNFGEVRDFSIPPHERSRAAVSGQSPAGPKKEIGSAKSEPKKQLLDSARRDK